MQCLGDFGHARGLIISLGLAPDPLLALLSIHGREETDALHKDFLTFFVSARITFTKQWETNGQHSNGGVV